MATELPYEIPDTHKYFVDDSTNEIHAFELDGSQDEYIKSHFRGPLTMQEVEALHLARLTAEEEARSYVEWRQLGYPHVSNQLDMIYWDKVNGTNHWEEAIAAVKAAYPKTSST
jgi:hypothetical protein